MCGTGVISLRLFLGRARSFIQQGLIQKTDPQPGLCGIQEERERGQEIALRTVTWLSSVSLVAPRCT